VGAEALLRWTHERFGFINTGVIVELSGVDGSIHDLGIWVIKRCLSDKLALNKAGLKELKVALNVSPCQFEKDDFFDRVISLVERTNIPPSSLELEITEGKKIDLDDRVLVGLQKLSKHGFNIAVDDFGMGYTSLRYLKSFPVNTLKIDGSIVKDVNDSKMVQEIISSVGQLANSMGVTLVVEWVETDSKMHFLIELGCDEFQGYLMSQSISLQDFTHFSGLKGVDNTKLKNPA
jgi:PTS system cellobiose-specific IIC component